MFQVEDGGTIRFSLWREHPFLPPPSLAPLCIQVQPETLGDMVHLLGRCVPVDEERSECSARLALTAQHLCLGPIPSIHLIEKIGNKNWQPATPPVCHLLWRLSLVVPDAD